MQRNFVGNYDVDALERFLFPLDLAYSAPLPSVALWRLPRVSDLGAEKIWLVRDGLLPLLWFFSRYPRPPRGFRPRLAVHESQLSIVPPSWRARVVLYRYSSLHAPRSRAIKRIGICTVISPLYCSLEYLKEKLRGARSKKSAIAALVWATVRENAFLPSLDPSFSFEFTRELVSAFQVPFVARPWQELAGSAYYGDVGYIDLNQRLLLADDRGLLAFLSKGAALCEQTGLPKARRLELLPSSDHHALELLTWPARTPFYLNDPSLGHMAEFLRASYEALPAEAELGDPTRVREPRLPWPSWITELGLAISRQARR